LSIVFDDSGPDRNSVYVMLMIMIASAYTSLCEPLQVPHTY